MRVPFAVYEGHVLFREEGGAVDIVDELRAAAAVDNEIVRKYPVLGPRDADAERADLYGRAIQEIERLRAEISVRSATPTPTADSPSS